MKFAMVVLITVFSPTGLVYAGEADVIKVDIKQGVDNTYQFHVTVQHKDEGW
jgi:hypothetical protein